MCPGWTLDKDSTHREERGAEQRLFSKETRRQLNFCPLQRRAASAVAPPACRVQRNFPGSQARSWALAGVRWWGAFWPRGDRSFWKPDARERARAAACRHRGGGGGAHPPATRSGAGGAGGGVSARAAHPCGGGGQPATRAGRHMLQAGVLWWQEEKLIRSIGAEATVAHVPCANGARYCEWNFLRILSAQLRDCCRF
ncbi:hypothetical protein R5R35_013194 [Gryllus longicercus]|uniref:Uncharacterized protein n=1 Tax=Gryllus longicercus TaxID=2509291 RepID=A0AAN9V069_9ORTH